MYRFKFGFIGEMDICTFLSLSREKYQKSATQGRPPKVPPLRNPPPLCATPSPSEWRRSLIARKVGDTRYPARTAERRPCGNRPKRGEERENFSLIPANRSVPRARRSAEVADCRRPVNYPRIRPFCPPAKRQRRTGDRILKESTWVLSLSGALLVLFSRQGEKSTHIHLPDKPQFTVPTLPS